MPHQEACSWTGPQHRPDILPLSSFQGKKPSYNPGLVTNCLLLLPYCVVTLVAAAGFFHMPFCLLSVPAGI